MTPHITTLGGLVVAVVSAFGAAPGPTMPSLPVASSAPVALPYVEPYVEPVVAPAVAPVVAPAPAPVAVPLGPGKPWFSTPRAAMRYLVWAYNGHHDRALRHVTTPIAREALVAMRDYAPRLRLVSCTKLPAGDYECRFTHTVAKHPRRHGTATFLAAPAVRHGWYMTVLAACGDDGGG